MVDNTHSTSIGSSESHLLIKRALQTRRTHFVMYQWSKHLCHGSFLPFFITPTGHIFGHISTRISLFVVPATEVHFLGFER